MNDLGQKKLSGNVGRPDDEFLMSCMLPQKHTFYIQMGLECVRIYSVYLYKDNILIGVVSCGILDCQNSTVKLLTFSLFLIAGCSRTRSVPPRSLQSGKPHILVTVESFLFMGAIVHGLSKYCLYVVTSNKYIVNQEILNNVIYINFIDKLQVHCIDKAFSKMLHYILRKMINPLENQIHCLKLVQYFQHFP